MRVAWALLMMILFMAPTTAEQESHLIRLMPWPQSVKTASGGLIISNTFSVSVSANNDPYLHGAVAIFLDDLRRHTGSLPLDFGYAQSDQPRLRISVDRARKPVQELGEDESYALEVTPSVALLKAPTTLGAMRGLQTFLQLVEITSQGFAVPAVIIQ